MIDHMDAIAPDRAGVNASYQLTKMMADGPEEKMDGPQGASDVRN